MSAVVEMGDRQRQHRRIVVTAIIFGAIALAFYIAVFVRFW